MDKKDKVIFKKFDNGDVIAVFPEIPFNQNVHNDCMSYMHIGQHGACSLSVMQDLEPATPDEYCSLQSELYSIGYTLKVIRRISQKMHSIRINSTK